MWSCTRCALSALGLLWSAHAAAGGYSLPEEAAEQPQITLNIPEITEEQAHELVDRAVPMIDDGSVPPTIDGGIDGALAVLRADRLPFYPNGVELASKIRGYDGLVMRAQLELAWGEALFDVSASFGAEAAQAQEALGQRLAELGGDVQAAVRDPVLLKYGELAITATVMMNAFAHVGGDHLGAGSQWTVKALKHPDLGYQGHRLAADFFLQTGEWERFDTSVANVRRLNPDSVGLLWLEGAEAWVRRDDPVAALERFDRALARDPEFTRARGWSVFAARGGDDFCRRWAGWKVAVPHHHITAFQSVRFDQECNAEGSGGSAIDQIAAVVPPESVSMAAVDLASLARVEERLATGIQGASSPVGSMDDASAVLKSDQLHRFSSAMEWAQAQKSIDGDLLAAQLELAWSEAQFTAADVLSALVSDAMDAALAGRRREALRITTGKAPEHGPMIDFSAAWRVRLEEAASLRAAGAAHLAAARVRVLAALKQAPEDYRSHRIAADYYRMAQDWEAFDIEVARAEKLRPDSNGLRFLRGVEAYVRHEDPEAGERHLAEALAADPAFTRARAQRVVLAPDRERRCEAMSDLQAAAPGHALAVLGRDVFAYACVDAPKSSR